MENEFYDRIVYKKSAFVDLKNDLNKYYMGKNVFVVSTKSLSSSYLTNILNSVSLAGCSFKYFVAKNNFSVCELNEISNMLTNESFDLFISVGAGNSANVVKYFSFVFNRPYFVCPTAPSSFSYFLNICINPFNISKSIVCDYPERIYINESIIKTCPQKLIKQGVFCIMSIEELISVNNIENILLDKHNNSDGFILVVERLKNEIKTILSLDEDGKLKLMDILIDAAYMLSKVDLEKNATFNFYLVLSKILQKNNEVFQSGSLLFLCSNCLINTYKIFFNEPKIKKNCLPNFLKVSKNIEKYLIFYSKINNFSYFNDILTKKELLLRLNNLKEEFKFQCQKRIDEQKIFLTILKSYDEIFDYDIPKFEDVFCALKIIPYVKENNIIVDYLCGMGYLNAV